MEMLATACSDHKAVSLNLSGRPFHTSSHFVSASRGLDAYLLPCSVHAALYILPAWQARGQLLDREALRAAVNGK